MKETQQQVNKKMYTIICDIFSYISGAVKVVLYDIDLLQHLWFVTFTIHIELSHGDCKSLWLLQIKVVCNLL